MDANAVITVTSIIAGSVVAIAMSVMFTRIGMRAFSVNHEATPRAFGLFFQELPATTTIVLIVVAVIVLAGLKVFPPDPAMTLLGTIAGYVLGNRDKHRPTPP